MKTIKYIDIGFDLDIPHERIHQFRAAIATHVGGENILFHHHTQNESQPLMYEYPLIQYKSIHNKAHIICLDTGTAEIYKIFNKPLKEIRIEDKYFPVSMPSITLDEPTLQLLDEPVIYRLDRWLALSNTKKRRDNEKYQSNFDAYMETDSAMEKVRILQKALSGHLVSFANGMDWKANAERRFFLEIVDFPKVYKVNYLRNKKENPVPLMAFNVRFKTDLDLPQYIGLGKSISKGFGIVSRME